MDAFTESIIGDLERRGIRVDKTLLADRIAGLKCRLPAPLEIVACDGETIVVKVFDKFQQVAVESGDVIAIHPHLPENAPIELTEEDERRAALRSAIEKAQKEVERLGDPANVRLPQLEEKGYSWSLTL